MTKAFACPAARGVLLSMAASVAFATSLPARAADGWQEGGSGAVAILPLPNKANAILGGSLVCAEQSWSFRLRTDVQSTETGPTTTARIAIGGENFSEAIVQADGVATVPAPLDMLDAMKSGNRLQFVLGEAKDAPRATFSLRNSKKVIDAIAPRCSQIDMLAFQAIELEATGPAIEAALPLVKDDVDAFRISTISTPTLTAKQVDREDGRQMLFASLCGSSWYFGRSGCTSIGFLRGDATAAWQRVLESEGARLYLDPSASNGNWPNIVTLALAGGAAPMHWIYNGSNYEPRDAIVAGDAGVDTDQGDSAQ